MDIFCTHKVNNENYVCTNNKCQKIFHNNKYKYVYNLEQKYKYLLNY